MFELDADKRFLTKQDVILACLYNPAILVPMPYKDFDRTDSDWNQNPRRCIRKHTRFMGWMLETFRDGVPFEGGRARNFYQRHQFGHHIVDDIYLVSAHFCMTNIDYVRDTCVSEELKPTFLFTGQNSWAQQQFETIEDCTWYYQRQLKFAQKASMEITLDKIEA